MGRLDGKVAIITGSAGGFGEAIARQYAQEGAKVLVADISESGEDVASDINKAGGRAVFTRFDCTKRADWEAGVELVLETFGKIDIVVNNAGTTYYKKPSVEVSEEEFDKIIALNTKSIYHSVAVVMPHLVKQRSGVFLSTSSVAGHRVRPGQVFYGGTKGFVNVVTQGLAAEYGPEGIRVNSICPVRGVTGLYERFSGVPDTPEERERFANSIPLRRMPGVNDVAGVAVFLASDEGAFISGVNMPVDGGRLAV